MRINAIGDAKTHPKRLYFVGFSGGFPKVLQRLLREEYPELDLVEFGSIEEALADAENKPTMILLDEVCCDDLQKQAVDLRRKFDHAMVVATFSGQTPSPACLQSCIMSRVACSYLPMDIGIEVWLAAIDLMLKGGRYVSPSMMDELLNGRLTNGHTIAASSGEPDSLMKEIGLLTRRELEVLDLVAQGQQNKNIAAELGLAENTVKLHVHHIITKLNASNRTEAAACYHLHLAAQRIDGSAR